MLQDVVPGENIGLIVSLGEGVVAWSKAMRHGDRNGVWDSDGME